MLDLVQLLIFCLNNFSFLINGWSDVGLKKKKKPVTDASEENPGYL